MQQLGIDIAKDKFDVALVIDANADPIRFKMKSFSNSIGGFAKLTDWIGAKASGPVHVCMEATGSYWEQLAEHLCDAGLLVSVVNPAPIKKESESWSMRNKTDEVDARMIARFCLAKRPRPWVAPAPEVRQLRDLVRHLQTLEDEKQAHLNRLGVTTSEAIVGSLEQLIGFLDEQIRLLEEQISEHIDRHPRLKRACELLSSVKGIGMKTAAVIAAEMPDVSNFSSSKAAVAYAGLSPTRMTSGKFVGQTKLCKMGNSRLRKALYFPALVAVRFNPVISEFYLRLRRNGKTKMSAIGACMRKMLAIAYGVLKTDTPFKVPV